MINSHPNLFSQPKPASGASHDATFHPEPHLDAVPVTLHARIIITALAAAGIALAALGAGFWHLQLWPVGFPKPVIEASTTATVEHWITVEPQEATSQLDIMGTISPGKTVPVVAPFDGVIREKLAQLGDQVEVGSALIVLDTSEIASRYRDAQSAYLKAAIAADSVRKWETSPEVQRSRRTLESAKVALVTIEQQLTDLKALLDQGIVSRNEYDGLVQLRDTQAVSVANANDDLLATLDRGSPDNRQLVMLDLQNSQARVDDLKRQLDGANVIASVAGILIRPPKAAQPSYRVQSKRGVP